MIERPVKRPRTDERLALPRSAAQLHDMETLVASTFLSAVDQPQPLNAQFAEPNEVGKLRASVRTLMFAYGDCANPLPESVNLMEELLADYLTQLSLQAARSAVLRPKKLQRGRPLASTAAKPEGYSIEPGPRLNVKTEDFLFALRHDPRKLARAKELLCLAAEIKQARSTTAMDPESLTQRQEESSVAPEPKS